MLNERKSKKKKQFKFILIATFIALFMMSFNTVESPTSKQKNKIFIITSQTSSKELKKIERHFKKGSVKLKFKKVKRNKDGDIYRILIKTKRISDKNYVVRKIFDTTDKNRINNFTLTRVGKKIMTTIINPKKDIIEDSSKGENIIPENFTLDELLKGGNTGFIITKNTTNSKLDSIINKFYEDEIIVDFKSIERNSKDEIIQISIFMKSETSEATYGLNSNIPLKPIGISSNRSGTELTIRTSNTDLYTTAEGNSTVHKVKKNNSFVFTSDNNDMHIIKDGKYKIISGNGTVSEDFGSEEGREPIYFIDEKEASKDDLNNLDSNNIKKINVLKGETAVEKYGQKGKNGVILVETKKQ